MVNTIKPTDRPTPPSPPPSIDARAGLLLLLSRFWQRVGAPVFVAAAVVMLWAESRRVRRRRRRRRSRLLPGLPACLQ